MGGVCCTNHQYKIFPFSKEKHSKYKKVKELGSGASCKVYQVQDLLTLKYYALKILNRYNQQYKTLKHNFKQYKTESTILQKLNHKNIVKLVDNWIEKNHLYLQFNVLNGGDLFDYIVQNFINKKYTEQHAANLTKQMLLALQHCHQHNIVHRDIKPENFVVHYQSNNESNNESNNKPFVIKLIDFGCARQVMDDKELNDIAGSPYYVAPEILSNDILRTGKILKAADVWSIGIILYIFIFGQPPFNGKNNKEIFQNISRCKLTFSSNNQCSDQVKDLISKLLHRHPKKRITIEQALKHPWLNENLKDSKFEKIERIQQKLIQLEQPKEVISYLSNKKSNKSNKEQYLLLLLWNQLLWNQLLWNQKRNRLKLLMKKLYNPLDNFKHNVN